MPRTIKLFPNNSRLEFDQGRFDQWCVYFVRPSGERSIPRDIDYFAKFQALGAIYGGERIYKDFVQVYQRTQDVLDDSVVRFITELCQPYRQDALQLDILQTTVYAGMIAEENKAGAILKKRIKRLGMHQVLLENMPPELAANYSRGRTVSEIVPDCVRRGF